jgi:hypothetical protein
MADQKISQLTAVTTPLAGTEVFPHRTVWFDKEGYGYRNDCSATRGKYRYGSRNNTHVKRHATTRKSSTAHLLLL